MCIRLNHNVGYFYKKGVLSGKYYKESMQRDKPTFFKLLPDNRHQ